MDRLGVQMRVMDVDPRRMDVAWCLAVWTWADSPDQVGMRDTHREHSGF